MSRVKSLILVGLITIPAAAFTFGGWAVVTVDDIPEYAVAGRPFNLSYTVRQHGMTPRGDLESSVTLTLAGKKISIPGNAMGEGIYSARVTFPQAGSWNVRIESGWGPVGGELLPMNVIATNAKLPAPMSGYDRGHQLYLAKGCATCHTHQLTKSIATVNAGPDLSDPKFSAEYLTRYLANPAIKTDWKNTNRMPNLGLRPTEITALIAFLNQEKGTTSR